MIESNKTDKKIIFPLHIHNIFILSLMVFAFIIFVIYGTYDLLHPNNIFVFFDRFDISVTDEVNRNVKLVVYSICVLGSLACVVVNCLYFIVFYNGSIKILIGYQKQRAINVRCDKIIYCSLEEEIDKKSLNNTYFSLICNDEYKFKIYIHFFTKNQSQLILQNIKSNGGFPDFDINEVIGKL
jgi:hypothetical protein